VRVLLCLVSEGKVNEVNVEEMMDVKRQSSFIKANLGAPVSFRGVGCQVGKLRLIDGYVRGFYRPGLNLI